MVFCEIFDSLIKLGAILYSQATISKKIALQVDVSKAKEVLSFRTECYTHLDFECFYSQLFDTLFSELLSLFEDIKGALYTALYGEKLKFFQNTLQNNVL